MTSTCMAPGCTGPHMANVMLSVYEKCVSMWRSFRACVVPVGREQELHGRRRLGGGGCGQWGRSWGWRRGFEMTHSSTWCAKSAKRFWMQDVWNRCSQLHYLMHVFSACSLGSILHLVGFSPLGFMARSDDGLVSVCVQWQQVVWKQLISLFAMAINVTQNTKWNSLVSSGTETSVNWPWTREFSTRSREWMWWKWNEVFSFPVIWLPSLSACSW